MLLTALSSPEGQREPRSGRRQNLNGVSVGGERNRVVDVEGCHSAGSGR